jgi:hypothetical protein
MLMRFARGNVQDTIIAGKSDPDAGHRSKFRICREHECGAIQGNRMAQGRADLQPHHRPANLYLNGDCTDANGLRY